MRQISKTLQTLTAILLLTVVPLSLNALEHDGKKLYMYGDSAIAIGRGGTGIASRGTDLFYINPAAVGDINRWSISFNYGTLPFQTEYNNPNITVSTPTSYGVIGTSIRYLRFSESDTFTNGYGGSFGIGKEITNQLLVGFSLSFFYGANSGSSMFIGGSIGTIYRFRGMSGGTFGIFDPAIGGAVRFGYPFGQESEHADFNSTVLGYQFSFLRIPNLQLTFYNEVTAYNYEAFPVSMGLEALLFDAFVIRTGGAFMNEFDYGDITAGLGYNFSFFNLEGSINYSLCYFTDGVLVHNVGLTIQFGLSDREPPETNISTNINYISPNHDGIQDYIIFNVNATDTSKIKGWRLQILDDAENLINEFRISDRDISDQLTFTGFFKRLFHKKENVVVPEQIFWDGTDVKRFPVPDGRYHYAFNAWDESDNISVLKKGLLFVDNTPPQIEVQALDTIFSPNKDYRKDELSIQQKVTTATDDIWEAEFKNEKGIAVKKYRWIGYEVPKKLIWDGLNDEGNESQEGVYDYTISCIDKAGNKASATIPSISLTRKLEVADCTISSEYFSRKIDKDISIYTYLSSQTGLETWGISVTDEDKKTVRDITGYEFQKLVIFDGKDNGGAPLSDGKYYITYTCLFHNGNMPQSFEKRLIMDSTSPDLDISHSPGLFSPDGDGEDDLLTLSMKGYDKFGIKNWHVAISSSTGYMFKTFEGKGEVPAELKWDGYGDSGEIVESAADYYAELSCFDMAGNYAKTSKERIKIDVLVLVTERGLKMQISNIEFALNSPNIMSKGRKILARVEDILNKYESYKVIIEGHTDDLGSEEHNLDLSEKRAKAVMNYLIGNGINPARLSFIGMGETTPLYPNTSEESRRRNRRVEFLLQKE